MGITLPMVIMNAIINSYKFLRTLIRYLAKVREGLRLVKSCGGISLCSAFVILLKNAERS